VLLAAHRTPVRRPGHEGWFSPCAPSTCISERMGPILASRVAKADAEADGQPQRTDESDQPPIRKNMGQRAEQMIPHSMGQVHRAWTSSPRSSGGFTFSARRLADIGQYLGDCGSSSWWSDGVDRRGSLRKPGGGSLSSVAAVPLLTFPGALAGRSSVLGSAVQCSRRRSARPPGILARVVGLKHVRTRWIARANRPAILPC